MTLLNSGFYGPDIRRLSECVRARAPILKEGRCAESRHSFHAVGRCKQRHGVHPLGKQVDGGSVHVRLRVISGIRTYRGQLIQILAGARYRWYPAREVIRDPGLLDIYALSTGMG